MCWNVGVIVDGKWYLILVSVFFVGDMIVDVVCVFCVIIVVVDSDVNVKIFVIILVSVDSCFIMVYLCCGKIFIFIYG